MNNKRILIIGWANSVHIQRWCNGLSKRGFEIKLISVTDGPTDLVETVILPYHGKLSYLANLSMVRKEAVKFNPGIVHAHYVAGNGLLGLFSSVHPLVLSVWGSDIDKNSNSAPVNWIVDKVLEKGDHITVTSNFLKAQTLVRLGGRKRPVSVIPFGVLVPDQAMPLPTERPFKICFLKDHKPVYGIDIAIRAFAETVKAIPDIEFTIAGKENSYTNELKSLAGKLNVSHLVKFAGQIGRDNIYQFISEHHLMLMPSKFEGFGVAALEASAAGRPVIASNVGGIPEVVNDGKTGILVPAENPKALAEAILKLANNFDLCDKMGREGREFVRQHYQWEKSLDLMSQLYEDLNHESPQN
ncbi:MAG TPA: glycosyltransferase family 4 protein [candidate division Zixibacteria bacterium]|nr:glycosyltransferase family 4 protein [candidate division Zixibacteria bacterium]